MRQGQQNRRNRGRGRSNNRSNNPLSRNYESNGPEVKIKGSAAHIAEKYTTLARDALSSGNTVTAENFFQHAEHYNRIIQAAQAKQEEHAAAQSAKSGRNNERHPRQPHDRDQHQSPTKKTETEKKATAEAPIPGTGKQPKIATNGNGAVDEKGDVKPKRKPRAPRKPKTVKAESAKSEDGAEVKDKQNNIVA